MRTVTFLVTMPGTRATVPYEETEALRDEAEGSQPLGLPSKPIFLTDFKVSWCQEGTQ